MRYSLNERKFSRFGWKAPYESSNSFQAFQGVLLFYLSANVIIKL